MTRQPADPWARFESPRALAIIVVVTAVLFGVGAGLIGYDLGSAPPRPALVIVFEPGAIQIAR